MSEIPPTETPYTIERPIRSVLIVHMNSKPYKGQIIPEASFTFRIGEPQFEVWERRFIEQQERLEKDQNFR